MSFINTTSLPVALSNHAAVVYRGYVYVIGGRKDAGAGTVVGTIYTAPINADGSLGAWTTAAGTVSAREYCAAVVVHEEATGKDYIVVVGGRNGSGDIEDAPYTIEVSSSGYVGTPALGSSLAEYSKAGLVAVGETIFLVGGENAAGTAVADVSRITLTALLSGDPWDGDTALPAARKSGGVVLDGRLIYYVGGVTTAPAASTTVYRGIVGPTITWATTTALATADSLHSSVVYENSVYRVGGSAGSTSIERAPIRADGLLGDWANVSTLPSTIVGTAAVVYRDRMYLLGGERASTRVATTSWEDTPSFHRWAGEDGTGLLKRLHVYYGGSLQFRYADREFGATNDHEIRLLRVGPVQRGLGADHVPMAADVEVILDNRDEVADWWVDRSTAANWAKATLRLDVGCYRTDAPTLIAWKQVGEYNVGDNPKRDKANVYFSMTEASRGALSEIVVLPAVRDWRDSGVGPLATSDPVKMTLDDAILDQPMPLAFGLDEVLCIPCQRQWYDPTTSLVSGSVILVMCASTTGGASTVSRLYARTKDFGVLEVPPTYPDVISGDDETVWESAVSGPFTVHGKAWYVHYIDLKARGYATWFNFAVIGDMVPDSFGAEQTLSWVEEWWATASPLSGTAIAAAQSQASPESVLRDLISQYTAAGYSYINEPSFTRVERVLHKNTLAAGTIAGGRRLRDVIGEICGSWDIDAFTDWSGRVAITGPVKDYESQTTELDGVLELHEEELADFIDGYPSRGQRWTLANRIFYDGIRKGVLERTIFPGPYTNALTALGTTRYVEQRVSVAWRSFATMGNDPWYQRGFDTVFRPVVQFTTGLGFTRLDLGDFFKLTWTRNLNAVYSSSLFKVEDLELDIDAGVVRVTAVWVGDQTSTRPFLLDDKTLLLVLDGFSEGITANVTDDDPVVSFSDPINGFNIQAGDYLILRDANETGINFKRNRALKIVDMPSSTTLEVEDDSLDFGSPSGTGVAEWTIRNGHLTGPSTNQPTYPDGSAVYGKISDLSSPSEYSDAVEAHVLLDG